ncbi:hypothetical protein M422DRAFT_240034 [Sphaerobolus stellatus SS14]|nr:hypothetical protein M422DRAFT_240034 [Sphaerobolus stellatus SS14]
MEKWKINITERSEKYEGKIKRCEKNKTIKRDGDVLRKKCSDFETQLRELAVKQKLKDTELLTSQTKPGASHWLQKQMSIPIPGVDTYGKLTKTGKLGKKKTCEQCKAHKDGEGKGKGHGLFICTDQFPLWDHLPYPLTGLNFTLIQKETPKELEKRGGGRPRPVFIPEVCTKVFKLAVLQEVDALARNQPLDIKIENLLKFEELACKKEDGINLRSEALEIGVTAYDFRGVHFGS